MIVTFALIGPIIVSRWAGPLIAMYDVHHLNGHWRELVNVGCKAPWLLAVMHFVLHQLRYSFLQYPAVRLFTQFLWDLQQKSQIEKTWTVFLRTTVIPELLVLWMEQANRGTLEQGKAGRGVKKINISK